MTLMLDIERIAKPVLRNASALPEGESLEDNVIDFILIMEGFISHIPELSKDDAKNLLEKTKQITRTIVEIDENRSSTDAPKFQFDYLLKTLSRLRSALHLYWSKDVPVNETPKELKEALSAASRASVLNTITKR